MPPCAVLLDADFPPLRAAPAPQAPLPNAPPAKARVVSKEHIHWSNRSLLQRTAGFDIVDCGGNGDCFFLSVCELLRRIQRVDMSAGQLRGLVADFIRDCPADAAGVLAPLQLQLNLTGEPDPSVRTLAAYAAHIRREGEHASALFEVPIVAELFNLRVRVVFQVQGVEGSTLGAEMRDRWVEPSRQHKEAPLDVHLLLLNKVSHAQRWVACAAAVYVHCTHCSARDSCAVHVEPRRVTGRR